MNSEKIKRTYRFDEETDSILKMMMKIENSNREKNELSKITETDLVKKSIRFYFNNYYNEDTVKNNLQTSNEYIINVLTNYIDKRFKLAEDRLSLMVLQSRDDILKKDR